MALIGSHISGKEFNEIYKNRPLIISVDPDSYRNSRIFDHTDLRISGPNDEYSFFEECHLSREGEIYTHILIPDDASVSITNDGFLTNIMIIRGDYNTYYLGG